MHAVRKRATPIDFALEDVDRQDLGIRVGHLHHGFAAEQIVSEQRVDSEQALVADGRDLDRVSVFHHHRHGRHAAIREEHLRDGRIDSMETLLSGDRTYLETGVIGRSRQTAGRSGGDSPAASRSAEDERRFNVSTWRLQTEGLDESGAKLAQRRRQAQKSRIETVYALTQVRRSGYAAAAAFP